MARAHSTGETHDDSLSTEAERKLEDLKTIDSLIDDCRNQLVGVSSELISSATREATLKMYRELRSEAERDDLRAERLVWAKGAMAFLNDTIDKAAAERERFKTDLESAVEKKWIRAESKDEWMRKFEDPGLLEMRRSAWIKNEWNGYKARWQKLATDRATVLNRLHDAGLTAKDIPEAGILADDAVFLSKGRSYHARRSLVDTVDAAIAAAARGKTSLLRTAEASLLAISSTPDRCLHPSKVGQWLKRMMNSGDPQQFSKDVLNPFFRNWKNARAAYDGVVDDYEAQGKPDGCMPISLNAFLLLPYDARMTTLAEARNRLTAAKQLETIESNDVAEELRDIRRSVDLDDLDAADVRLAGLRLQHPEHPDVRSITEHIAVLRAERDKNNDSEKEESVRTEEALVALREMEEKLPTGVAATYAHLFESGDVEQAALVFKAIQVRADRMKSGRTSAHDELRATMAAEEAEEADIIPQRPEIATSEAPDESELLVTEGTPPAVTISMLKAHAAKGAVRSPALVFGIPADQQMQLAELSAPTLAHMRHLDNVGERYRKGETARAA